MYKTILYLFFLIPSILFSQSIKVVDLETQKPIKDVWVTSSAYKETRYTDNKGKVNILLDKGDTWYEFLVDGYYEVGLSASEILALGYVVEMDRLKESLKEVIVSNTKWTQSKQKISRKIIQISKEDVFETNPQTAADLVQKSGNVFVQKSQLGGGSPFIRGFSANRLLLSVDGVRINNAIFRAGNVQNIISIDPLFVDTTEVLLGSGSVIYGSDAVGGVINFRTLSPKISKSGNLKIKGNTLFRTATANKERTIHADISLSGAKLASVTSVSYNNFSDLIQGSNGLDDYLRNEFVETTANGDVVVTNANPKNQVASGYEQYNFLQKLIYVPNKHIKTELGLIYTATSEYNRYDRLLRKRDGQFQHAEWFYGPQRWFMGTGIFSYKKKHSFFDEFKITNAYQSYKESRNIRDFNTSIRTSNLENVDIYTFNFDARKTWNKINFSYGLEYVFNKVGSKAFELDISSQRIRDVVLTRYPNGATWQSLAGYSIANFDLNERLALSAGIRYNHILLDAKFNSSDLDFPFSESKINTGAVTGSLGVNWKMLKNIILKANANTAFRAPNIDDVGKTVLDSEPGTLTVPNPNLKSEYAYNFELGGTYKKDDFKLSLIAYYSFLDNALTRSNFELNGENSVVFRGQESQVLAIQNSEHLYVNGFEMNTQIPLFNNFQLLGGYTITRGSNILSDDTKVAVRHVSPDFGNIHLKYEKKKWMLDVYTEFSKGFSFDELAPSERGKIFIYASDANGNPFLPSWMTVNLRGKIKLNQKLSFTSALENITDQRYRTYSSGISAPGINFIASLNYLF